jgi:hypothetical protein
MRTFLTLLLFLPGAVGAVDFSGRDLDPMVRVKSHQMTFAFPPATEDIRDDDTYFVTRGGATVFVSVIQLTDSQTRRTVHQIGRGIGSSAPLARLKGALAAARAGIQASCIVLRSAPPVDIFEITWYGRNARQNQFTVVFGPIEAAALPPCPVEVPALVAALVNYQVEVLNDPESEVFTNE